MLYFDHLNIFLYNTNIGYESIHNYIYIKYIFVAIDQEVRLSLIKHNVHLKPGCKERLYLPRNEMGRGPHSVEMKSECMLLKLCETLEKYKNISSRRAAILKVEEQEKNTSISHKTLSQVEILSGRRLCKECYKCSA
ncbi:hypothetical protein TCON_2477 [Astathelohania contejeani]|uniref:GIY-YIG homing endonuclease n=1 Tax=Astathelohania contejeani TaxID=164912 RepID=A0ABQ7HVV8_9MICR|nr:hypothetical protein TCON_2477 [Thelohania contejeani]